MSKYGVFSGPYFPAFGLNTDQKKTSYLDTFHAVENIGSFLRKNLVPFPNTVAVSYRCSEKILQGTWKILGRHLGWHLSHRWLSKNKKWISCLKLVYQKNITKKKKKKKKKRNRNWKIHFFKSKRNMKLSWLRSKESTAWRHGLLVRPYGLGNRGNQINI